METTMTECYRNFCKCHLQSVCVDFPSYPPAWRQKMCAAMCGTCNRSTLEAERQGGCKSSLSIPLRPRPHHWNSWSYPRQEKHFYFISIHSIPIHLHGLWCTCAAHVAFFSLLQSHRSSRENCGAGLELANDTAAVIRLQCPTALIRNTTDWGACN